MPWYKVSMVNMAKTTHFVMVAVGLDVALTDHWYYSQNYKEEVVTVTITDAT